MKTIVETSSGLSKYLLADDVTITATADNITVGDPAQFIIGDLNSTTVTVTDNVTNAPICVSLETIQALQDKHRLSPVVRCPRGMLL
jgi:hypothetical protein